MRGRDAHLSRSGALAHDDLAVGGHLWRVVVDVQHLHGDGDVAQQAGVVCRRDAAGQRSSSRHLS